VARSEPSAAVILPAADLLPILLSPIVGSFLGVVVTRAETPAAIVFGRSECPHCHTRLAARDLLPLLSYLALRGRCRHCGKRIDPIHPFVEIGALAVALWAALVAAGPLLWLSCLLGWALLALALIDLRLFLLPDFLTLPLAAVGIAAGWWLEPEALLDHLLGAAIGLLFVIFIRQMYYLLRGREGIGLGDAKLLAAAGAFVSWEGLPSVLAVAALSALAVILLGQVRGARVSATDPVPFGAYLCLGFWIVWLYGPLA
jgi:leader peptidase (prepilin peptidase) / N-methyltransferase